MASELFAERAMDLLTRNSLLSSADRILLVVRQDFGFGICGGGGVIVEVLSSEWLAENVGKPSNSWGSKYSAIYKATVTWEKTKSIADLKEIARLLYLWFSSRHKGAKSEAAKDVKEEQQLQLNRFFSFVNGKILETDNGFTRDMVIDMKTSQINYAKELAMVEDLIKRMADSSTPILQNTGRFLTGRPILMLNANSASNGQWTNGGIEINPVMAYNESELKGTLVHEVQHALCRRPSHLFTYLDEFSAHAKQYSITRPKASEAELVAMVTKVMNALYKEKVDWWINPPKTGLGMLHVTRLEQLGDFAIPDNAGEERLCQAHGCEPG